MIFYPIQHGGVYRHGGGDPIVHVSDTRDPSRIQRAKTNKETKEERKCVQRTARGSTSRKNGIKREREGEQKNRSHYVTL